MTKTLGYLTGLALALGATIVKANDTSYNTRDVESQSRTESAIFQNALNAQRADNFVLAEKLWKDLRTIQDRPEVLNNLAAQAHTAGQDQRALELLEQATKLTPYYYSIHNNLQRLSDRSASEGLSPGNQSMQLQLIEALPAPGIPVVPRPITKISAAELYPLSRHPTDESHMAEQRAIIKKFMSAPSNAIGDPPKNSASEDVNEIAKALNEWKEAWATRDLRNYFAAYDVDFVPRETLSRDKWESNRRDRIQGASNLKISISDLQVDIGPNAIAGRTRFVQHYQSDSFQDKVMKTLHWTKRGDTWRITSETTVPMQ